MISGISLRMQLFTAYLNSCFSLVFVLFWCNFVLLTDLELSFVTQEMIFFNKRRHATLGTSFCKSFSFYKIKQWSLTFTTLPFICLLTVDRGILEKACAVFALQSKIRSVLWLILRYAFWWSFQLSSQAFSSHKHMTSLKHVYDVITCTQDHACGMYLPGVHRTPKRQGRVRNTSQKWCGL